MKIKELLKSSGINCNLKDNFKVNGVALSSKQVREDFVFIAIKGNRSDGNIYIDEAIKNGAKVIVHSAKCIVHSKNRDLVVIKVKDARKAAAKLAASFYDHPSAKMHVVGVTGTNGKTTVTYLIEAIIRKAKFKSGVIGTINYRFQNKVISSTNTTPGPVDLQKMLSDMRNAGVKFVAMEVSSHALDQDRVAGIDFKSAIFTNITQDHLDYHRTKANYFKAKSRLFSALSRGSKAIINADDRHSSALKKITKARVVTYAIDRKADYYAREIKFDVRHTEFLLVCGKKRYFIKTSLVGKYNVYNILAAAAWAREAGFSLKNIKAAVEGFGVVPGRLERVKCDKGYSVFVDYAHTEDALKNVLITLQQLPNKRIIVVFGCGGERDRSKRPKMGRVVSEMADYCVVTSDNPRSEDPELIAQEIIRGIVKNNYRLVLDRAEAIKEAFDIAASGDIVLLAGKGHEDYQILKRGKVPFSDREVALRCLR
jgi:UDP-N-acetylmuramoyl-L-alanyl-D-glutamate--2,6-diaminopimelate ligase